MNSLLVLFIVLSIINVIGGTIKSIATVNGSTMTASIVNALYFGFYTIVIIYTSCELNLWLKVFIVAISNFIGVFIVKTIEKKLEKDKMWLVKMTIHPEHFSTVQQELEKVNIPFSYYDITKYYVFDCYCATKKETEVVTQLCSLVKGKLFASKGEITM